MNLVVTSILALGAVMALPAIAVAQNATAKPAETSAYTGPVAVIVSFPMMKGATRKDVEALFTKYTPFYEAQEGLKQKYFTLDEKTRRMGGIYLWKDEKTARAFYNDAWRQTVVQAFGAEPELVWYDVPSVIQGKAGMP